MPKNTSAHARQTMKDIADDVDDYCEARESKNIEPFAMSNLAAALPAGEASSTCDAPKRQHRRRRRRRKPNAISGHPCLQREKANRITYPTIKEVLRQHPDRDLDIFDEGTYMVAGQWLRTIAEDVVVRFISESREIYEHIDLETDITSLMQLFETLIKLTRPPPGAPTRSNGQHATTPKDDDTKARNRSWVYRTLLCKRVLQHRPVVETFGTIRQLSTELRRLADCLQEGTLSRVAREADKVLKENAQKAKVQRAEKWQLVVDQAQGKGLEELLSLLEEDIGCIREVHGMEVLWMVGHLKALRGEMKEMGE